MANVLIVDNSTYMTGANRSIANYASVLSGAHNYSWAVTTMISDEDLRAVIGSQPFERFDFVEVSRRPGDLIKYLPRLVANTRKLIRNIGRNAIDIVHVNDCYNMCGVLLKVLRPKTKVVYHVRLLRSSYISRFYGAFTSMIKRRADAIVCCSEAVAADVGPSPIPKSVVYDGAVFPDDFDTSASVRTEAKKLIYVGNTLPGKGQGLALEAFAASKCYPQMRLHFVGKFGHNQASAEFKQRLDAMIDRMSLRPYVSFDGFKADIQSEMRSADIALNMSESESFSMVCLDALRAGVPLIAADSGGPRELFEHMRSGWLVPNRDTDAAAEAIATLSKDTELRAMFSTEGKRNAFYKFNVITNAEQLDSEYRRVLGR